MNNRPQLFARLILAGIGLLVLTLALSFAGCRSVRPAPVGKVGNLHTASADTVQTLAQQPVPFTERIGLSTSEGRAHRQAVRLARASVPRTLGKGAVYAPQATQVAAGFKNRAAVISADSGATVTAIEKVKAPLAIGAGATATSTTVEGISLWWLLLLLIPAAWWAYRKTFPFA